MTTVRVITQPSCADASDASSLSVRQARQAIHGALRPIDSVEQVPLRAALGRVLGSDCISPVDVPGHTNSAMDGYALSGSDLPADGVR